MLKKFKKLSVTLASMLLLAVPAAPLLVPATVGAQTIKENICKGIDDTTEETFSSCAETNDNSSPLNKILKTIIRIFSIVVGAASVIMIIYGGFKYITSGGNDGSVSSAKNTILYAVIGLIVVALAQLIVRFVLTETTV